MTKYILTELPEGVLDVKLPHESDYAFIVPVPGVQLSIVFDEYDLARMPEPDAYDDESEYYDDYLIIAADHAFAAGLLTPDKPLTGKIFYDWHQTTQGLGAGVVYDEATHDHRGWAEVGNNELLSVRGDLDTVLDGLLSVSTDPDLKSVLDTLRKQVTAYLP